MRSYNNNVYHPASGTAILAIKTPQYTDFRVLLIRSNPDYVQKYGQQPEFATDLLLNPGGPQEIPWRTESSNTYAEGVHFATGWSMGQNVTPMPDYAFHPSSDSAAGQVAKLPTLYNVLPAPLIPNQRYTKWNPNNIVVAGLPVDGVANQVAPMQARFGPTPSDVMTHPINRGAYEVLMDEKFTLSINVPGISKADATSRRFRLDFPVNALVEFEDVPATYMFSGFSDQLQLGTEQLKQQRPTTKYAQKLHTGKPRLLILASGPGGRTHGDTFPMATTGGTVPTNYLPSETWSVRTRGNTTYRDSSSGPGIPDMGQLVQQTSGFDPTVVQTATNIHGHGTIADITTDQYQFVDNQ